MHGTMRPFLKWRTHGCGSVAPNDDSVLQVWYGGGCIALYEEAVVEYILRVESTRLFECKEAH